MKEKKINYAYGYDESQAIGRPALLKVRNSNTGARANAGPREEFVMDKLNTLLKRLNVYGYRHYHNFDEWMRRTLLETVQAELLSPDAHVQAFVARPALAPPTVTSPWKT